MSKNKKAKTAEVKPVVKPNVVTLKPLNIIQPVSICQTFKTVQTAYVEPEPPVIHKCKMKKAQRRWGLLALILLVVTVVLALFVAPDFTAARVAAFSTLSCGLWTLHDWVLYIGTFIGAVTCVSILVRWIGHSIGCKAKRKNLPCCKKCEFYKFIWTFVFISIVAFLGLSFANVLGYNNVRDNLLEVVTSIFANGFTFANPKYFVGAIGLAILLGLFVFFVILTLAHKARDKRRAKYIA